MKPWQHQLDVVQFSKGQKGTLWNHEMGTGKTYSALLNAQAEGARKILVIAPKVVLPVWDFEFTKFSPGEFMVKAFIKGSIKKKAEQIKLFMAANSHKKKVVVLNYEAIWRDGFGEERRHGRVVSEGFLRSYDWDMIIFDEAHKICRAQSNVSKYSSRLVKSAKKVIALTGTPLPNGCLSAYGLYRALDKNIFGTSEHRFKMRYAQFGGYENHEIIGYINQDEFKKKFASICHTALTKDCLDLPDGIHQDISVRLCPKAMKLYQEFKKECIIEFKTGAVTAENVLVKYLRLAQIASGSVTDEEGHVHNVDNSKIEAVKEIVEGIGDEAIIIFAKFKDEVKRAKEILSKDYTVSELSGSMNELAEWQRKDTQILIMNIQAGAVGINCSRARFCIYLSTGYSYPNYIQSLARTRRPGATGKITYYHINALDTIDVAIAYAMQNKQDIIETLLREINAV